MTTLAVKIVAAALRQFPQFNVSIDMAAEEIVVSEDTSTSAWPWTPIAALLVPVVRDADTKSLMQISEEVAALAEKARSRKLSLEEMQGGTFSLSNLGGIGGNVLHAARQRAGSRDPRDLRARAWSRCSRTDSSPRA